MTDEEAAAVVAVGVIVFLVLLLGFGELHRWLGRRREHFLETERVLAYRPKCRAARPASTADVPLCLLELGHTGAHDNGLSRWSVAKLPTQAEPGLRGGPTWQTPGGIPIPPPDQPKLQMLWHLERVASAVAESRSVEGVARWWDTWARSTRNAKRAMEVDVLDRWSGEPAQIGD